MRYEYDPYWMSLIDIAPTSLPNAYTCINEMMIDLGCLVPFRQKLPFPL